MSRNYYGKYNLGNNEYMYCIKCKNHKVCDGLLPDKWYETRGKYVCIQCEKNFGNLNKKNNYGVLEFKNNITCLQCNNKSDGIKYPFCDQSYEHYLCIQCFDNIWYSCNKIPEPIFPYDEEIEDEYYKNPNNVKWNKYPLIYAYNKQINLWKNLKDEIFEKNEPFKKCPICKV